MGASVIAALRGPQAVVVMDAWTILTIHTSDCTIEVHLYPGPRTGSTELQERALLYELSITVTYSSKQQPPLAADLPQEYTTTEQQNSPVT